MKNTTTALATVATTNTAVAVNSAKANVKPSEIVANIAELKAVFVGCGVLPKYTDNSHYVGCGTKANTFSVNLLKTRYNVYCSNDTFAVISEAKLKDVECIAGANSSDKTRPNTITIKSTAQLKKALALILKSDAKIALQ